MNFESFYNDTYNDFYNACEHNNLISNKPIPYNINENLRTAAEYSDGSVNIKKLPLNSKSEEKQLRSTLYHEFTHYYDEELFKHHGYPSDDINILMLTFSEIHASYNGILSFLNYKDLKVKRRIPNTTKIFENKNILQFCAFQTSLHVTNLNNVLGFKHLMYLLGEKRAFLAVSQDIQSIIKAYNPKCIPNNIRNEITEIDKSININIYKNIDVSYLSLRKLKVETMLTAQSLKNIHLPITPETEDIRKIIDSIQ